MHGDKSDNCWPQHITYEQLDHNVLMEKLYKVKNNFTIEEVCIQKSAKTHIAGTFVCLVTLTYWPQNKVFQDSWWNILCQVWHFLRYHAEKRQTYKQTLLKTQSPRISSSLVIISTACHSVLTPNTLHKSQLYEKKTVLRLYTEKWVAVYLETYCNIGSKRAFPTGVLDRWHNCLLIYWCTSYLVPAFDDT